MRDQAPQSPKHKAKGSRSACNGSFSYDEQLNQVIIGDPLHSPAVPDLLSSLG